MIKPGTATRKGPVTKQEVIETIVACAEKLGHVPSIPELMKHAGIDRPQIRKHFGNYEQALEECKLEIPERGRKVEIDRLFRDWAGVVRALKRLPSVYEYEKLSRYSVRPLRKRFGVWAQVPVGLRMYAEDHGLAEEWKDVLVLVGGQEGRQEGCQDGEQAGGPRGGQGGSAGMSRWKKIGAERDIFSQPIFQRPMFDRPMYGPLIRSNALVYAPTNESGVVCLFGAMAEQLGFLVLRIQTEFPDCEAMRLVGKDRLQPVRIEFEYESRNFLRHMHDVRGCDLIVCWEHNWPECPLEVVELKRYCQN
ncbi:MAG: TetR/AcrR family transcriptional regulator [Acidobacteriia bacterium]|nr:TetR/AcrR family transcriptional regulator [Terriglobia bacterium]